MKFANIVGWIPSFFSKTETKKFQNQDTVPFRRLRNSIFSFVVSQLISRKSFRRRTLLLAERVEWITWVEDNFLNYNFYWTREALWIEMQKLLGEHNDWKVYEFGVAWGYATNFWTSRIRYRFIAWHGFDRFTGLPRSWRDLEQSSFGTGGIPPAVTDPRVAWHVGDVEQELPKLEITPGPKIVLFDLDIYEPTLFAWTMLSPHLSPGDLIFFDEGFDQDERRVINESVRLDFELNVVGITHTAIAFKLGNRLRR
jgi:hypothetical protein